MFNPEGMLNDFKTCMSLNAPACSGSPVKSAVEVRASPGRCRELFAYQFSRDMCMKLQTRMCGRGCASLVNTSNANVSKDCIHMQEILCKVNKPGPTPVP